MTRPLAGLLAAVLLLAGCSDDPSRSSDDPEPTRHATTTSAPASSTPTGSPTVPPTLPPTQAVLDDEARTQLVEASTRATETMLSYDHRTLDSDLENATALLTPEFAALFTKTYDTLRGPAVASKASVRAVVRSAGLIGATPDEARVLVLVDQTSRTQGAPKRTTRQAPVVTLQRTGDVWLVSDLQAGGAVAPMETDPARRAVLEAASTMAQAFLNVSWTTIEADVDRVRELATSPLLESYTTSSEALVELIRTNRTVQESQVLVAGLVSARQDTATVIVTANGTSRNDGTAAKPQQQHYRLQLDLRLVDGSWLTSDLELVQ